MKEIAFEVIMLMLKFAITKVFQKFRSKRRPICFGTPLVLRYNKTNLDQCLKQWYKGKLDELYLQGATIPHYINKSSLTAALSMRPKKHMTKGNVWLFIEKLSSLVQKHPKGQKTL